MEMHCSDGEGAPQPAMLPVPGQSATTTLRAPVSPDDPFEPVMEDITPSAGKRAASAAGLLVLLTTLGIVAGAVILVVVVLGILALNSAL